MNSNYDKGIIYQDYEDDEVYTLTPWGCLYGVLNDYGIRTDHIKGRMGEHIVEDFMDLMVQHGFVAESETEE